MQLQIHNEPFLILFELCCVGWWSFISTGSEYRDRSEYLSKSVIQELFKDIIYSVTTHRLMDIYSFSIYLQ